jgi:hypothetical protein
MKEAFTQRRFKQLVPVSQEDEDIIMEYPENRILRLQIYGVQKPRSVRQLNMFWACCETVCQNTEDPHWNTKEKVAFQIKVALHHIDVNQTIVDPKGNVHFVWRSISFKELPHLEACRFFERAWPIMAKKIGITEEELLRNANG